MKRILVVEDNSELSKLLELILRRAGYDVTLAMDGADALRQFQSRPADLVLLDIMLPSLDGYEVSDHIRHVLGSDVPIIMLSSLDSYLDMERSRRVGATDHIAKPFDKDKLLAIIAKYTEEAKAA